MATWDSVHKNLVNDTAKNGMVQTRVESVKSDLNSRQISLAGMMGISPTPIRPRRPRPCNRPAWRCRPRPRCSCRCRTRPC
uniref:Uncharacterized protein n=1 Tax=Phenylobacterium glaciei TaxID=2803784 RepID=A0A974P215_9CAUL|nr:hypothetical protein JKL49_21560 [Phenylobacterium glaciei]